MALIGTGSVPKGYPCRSPIKPVLNFNNWKNVFIMVDVSLRYLPHKRYTKAFFFFKYNMHFKKLGKRRKWKAKGKHFNQLNS